MFRHRCRRRQLINRLWNRRLRPNSTYRPRQVNASNRLRQGAEGRQEQHPEVGSPYSSSAGVFRDVISSCLRHCCSCWSSSASQLNVSDDNDDEAQKSEVDDEGASKRSLPAVAATIMKHDAIERLFDLLRLDQLETLAEVVCGGLSDDDGEAGSCVITSARRPQRSNVGDDEDSAAVVEPHVVSCGLWRWPELIDGDQGQRLKPMPRCVMSRTWKSGVEDSECDRVVCCNPYHWSRLLQLPVEEFAHDSKEDGRAVSDDIKRLSSSGVKSTDTTADSSELGNSRFNSSTGVDDEDDFTSGIWSTLAYWEHDRRVGPLCAVRDRRIEVFDRLARGNGLCLSLLDRPHEERRQVRQTSGARSCPITRSRRAQTDSVRRTREKIGSGLVLSLERDPIGGGDRNSLWLYNRSQYPVFVSRERALTSGQSGVEFEPSMDVAGASSIEKLPSGFVTRLFGDLPTNSCRRDSNDDDCNDDDDGDGRSDFRRDVWTGSGRFPKRRAGGEMRRCAKISFVKGWGPGYRRTCVTSCPCWLEVLVGVR